MNKLNIHEKVSLLAQTKKSKPKGGKAEQSSEGDNIDERELNYLNEIKPTLNEEDKQLIQEYMNKLCELGNYREVDIYYLFKKYDFNIIVIEDLVNVLIKKKEEAMKDNNEWVFVKPPVPRKNSHKEDDIKNKKGDVKQNLDNKDQENQEHNKEETKRPQKAFAKNRKPINNTNNEGYNNKYSQGYANNTSSYYNKYTYDDYDDYKNYVPNNDSNYYNYNRYYNDGYYTQNKRSYYNNNTKKRGNDYDDLERELNELNYITPQHILNKSKTKGSSNANNATMAVVYVRKDEIDNEQNQEKEESKVEDKTQQNKEIKQDKFNTNNSNKYSNKHNKTNQNSETKPQQQKNYNNNKGNRNKQNRPNKEVIYIKKEEIEKKNDHDNQSKNEKTELNHENIPIKKHYSEHNIHEFFKETNAQVSTETPAAATTIEKKKSENPLPSKENPLLPKENALPVKENTLPPNENPPELPKQEKPLPPPQIIEEPQAKQIKADTNIPTTQATQKPIVAIQQPQITQITTHLLPSSSSSITPITSIPVTTTSTSTTTAPTTTTTAKILDTNPIINPNKSVLQETPTKMTLDLPPPLNKAASTGSTSINPLNNNNTSIPFSFQQINSNNNNNLQNKSPSKGLPNEQYPENIDPRSTFPPMLYPFSPTILPSQGQSSPGFKDPASIPNQNQPKDMPPFFGMPYIVIPQPNGTFIIQPLQQMPYQVPYIVMPTTQVPSQIPSHPVSSTSSSSSTISSSQMNPQPSQENDDPKKFNPLRYTQTYPYTGYTERGGSIMNMHDPRVFFNFGSQDNELLKKVQPPQDNIDKFFPKKPQF